MSSETSGWEAIDAALGALYTEQPYHVGKLIPSFLGGPGGPLRGTSVYSQQGHWHYISYGLSELYEKESDDPEWSGFGLELTLRLPHAGESEPPQWPIFLLDSLAATIFESGRPFQHEQRWTLPFPLTGDAECAMRAFATVLDPQLPPISTPNGRAEFIQLFGLTDAEVEQISAANSVREGVRLLLQQHGELNPLLITDITR